ncbi:MAG: GTP 3',8-cyclase MoaA [Bdellovibrionota bacterium]
MTDICNFRCVYCLPNGYFKKSGTSPLSVEEIKNLVIAFSKLGFWKVRLTGGEPTVRRDIVEIVRVVSSVPGIRKVALTTNGHRLSKLVLALKEAGLHSLNVSIDSLKDDKFREITGKDALSGVLNGLDAALSAGFESLKVNVVLLKGVNDEDIGSFMEWGRHKDLSIRFIELMRTGANKVFFQKSHLSGDGVRKILSEKGWLSILKKPGDGPAVEFAHPDYKVRIGVIAPYSQDFCKDCNRLRVDSLGNLRLCLFGESDYPLRPLLGSESDVPAAVELIRSLIERKPKSHFLHEEKYGNARSLSAIGG